MTDNVTPMPGVKLPAQIQAAQAEQDQAQQQQLLAVVDELRTLAAQGQIKWFAMVGEFDNANKLSAFGNINVADPLRVVGAVEWLKAEYIGAVTTGMAVRPKT